MLGPVTLLRAVLLAVVVCSLCACTATGQSSFSINVATGYDKKEPSGHSITESGHSDMNWVVNAPGTTGVRYAYIVAATDADFSSDWIPNGPHSSWVSFKANTATPLAGVALYEQSVVLSTQTSLASLSLDGSLLCANSCELRLNGHSLVNYTFSSDQTPANFTASHHYFGFRNLLILRNKGDGATGVRVEGLITGSLLPPGGVVGDPQFVGLRGQSFQVHGIDGAVYNIVSESNTQVNARFVFLQSGRCPMIARVPETWSNCWSHPGSYMGDMSFQQVVDGALHAALVVAGGADIGFDTVQMDGKDVAVGDIMRFVDPATNYCFSLHYTSTHTVTVQMEHYESRLTNSDMFINQALRPTVPISQLRSHGLLGQTHSIQMYASSVKYIEGDVDDYVIESQDIFGKDFHFNHFLD